MMKRVEMIRFVHQKGTAQFQTDAQALAWAWLTIENLLEITEAALDMIDSLDKFSKEMRELNECI